MDGYKWADDWIEPIENMLRSTSVKDLQGFPELDNYLNKYSAHLA